MTEVNRWKEVKKGVKEKARNERRRKRNLKYIHRK